MTTTLEAWYIVNICRDDLSYTESARDYSVSAGTISRIKNRKTFAALTAEWEPALRAQGPARKPE